MSLYYLTDNEDCVLIVNDYDVKIDNDGFIPLKLSTDTKELISHGWFTEEKIKIYCKKVTVHKGCNHNSNTKVISQITFKEPIELNELLRKWRTKLPKFDDAIVINKKRIGNDLWI